MNQILKTARLEKAEISDSELALINRQTLREFTAEEVFTFRLAACDNQIDRDLERFTERTLAEFAGLFPGRPVLRDHQWRSGAQTARVYAADVETDGDVQRLVLRCYLPRTDATAPVILSIESGILREASVGVSIRRALCSICGADQTVRVCEHRKGAEYDGQVCHIDLDGAADAYEVSLVPVPAQPAAGIVKSKRYGGTEEPPAGEIPAEHPDDWQADALLNLEKQRFMEVSAT